MARAYHVRPPLANTHPTCASARTMGNRGFRPGSAGTRQNSGYRVANLCPASAREISTPANSTPGGLPIVKHGAPASERQRMDLLQDLDRGEERYRQPPHAALRDDAQYVGGGDETARRDRRDLGRRLDLLARARPVGKLLAQEHAGARLSAVRLARGRIVGRRLGRRW